MCNNEDHQRFRKLMNHAFTSRAVWSQESLLQSHVGHLINGLGEKCKERPAALNMTLWYDAFGLDVISGLTYGQSFNCLASRGSPTRETSIISSSLKGSTWYRAIRRMPKPIQSIICAMLPKKIVQMRQMRMKYSIQKIFDRIQRPDERPDVYFFISGSADKGKMSADEMASSLSILMAAGSETTATTLAGCTYLLLRNPTVFTRLQNEIVQKFRTDDEINLSELIPITFLSAVIEETLRLYPPTRSTLPRRTPPEGALISGRRIPGDTIVEVNHWVTNRSERHFVRATQFAPERWMGDEAFSADDKSAFKPFMLGPRNCVGQKFVNSCLVYGFKADNILDWQTQSFASLLPG